MDHYLYSCQYCCKQYTPKRRFKQRFCSSSCRVNSFNKNKQKNLPLKSNSKNESEKPIQIEKMSLPGVGNAAVGTLAANAITNFFTSEENKPATKKDLKNLITTIKGRYFPIKNIRPRIDGAKAYYDIQTQMYVFLK